MKTVFPLLVSSLLLLLSLSSCSGQGLSRVLAGSNLPQALEQQTMAYDDEDNVYIIGGYSPWYGESRGVLRFKMSLETLDDMGTTPRSSYGGTAQFGPDGKATIMGDYPYGSGDSMSFNPKTSSLTHIEDIPYRFINSFSIKANSEEMLIFNGQPDGASQYSIISYNMVTQTFKVSAELPVMVNTIKAAVVVGTKAFLFGEGQEFQLDLESMEVQPLDIPGFPQMDQTPSAVYDGQNIYIIGGYTNYRGKPTYNGILQLNPNTLKLKFIPVQDFPFGGNLPSPTPTNYVRSPFAVYSSSTNRIYLIGGKTNVWMYGPSPLQTEISYIDLTPISPMLTTTTAMPTTTQKMGDPALCLNREIGMYPHPNMCSSFIGCHDGNALEYSCPDDLLFDTTLNNCNLPSDVECYQSCKDKEDGIYQHLGDCSYFVICKEGEAHSYQCPQNLMFDAETRMCTFEENAQCEVPM